MTQIFHTRRDGNKQLFYFGLTTNIEGKYFHNSIDWSGLFYRGACSDLQSSDYWEMYLWTSSPPWYDLIISTLCRTNPSEKTNTLRERNYAIVPLKNHVECVLPQHLQASGLKLVNILGLAKVRIEQQQVSGMKYLEKIIGILPLKASSGTPSCFSGFLSNQWILARYTVDQITRPAYWST